MDIETARKLASPNTTKIVLCLVDGLGGLPKHETLRSELEKADTQNLDRLAVRSEVGLTVAAGAGVVVSERAAALALLGYAAAPPGRGDPSLPPFEPTWGVRAAALVDMPSALATALGDAGIRPLEAPATLGERIEAVGRLWDDYDLFVIGYGGASAAALAGDFERKCHALHDLDARVPDLLGLRADVLAIAGGRSIPALMARPTWHPVPFLLHSDHCREGNAQRFNEQECLKGSLGILPATDIMPLIMAHALRLNERGD